MSPSLHLCVLCVLCGSISAAPARPNILFFFADDWGRDAPCYADPAKPSPSDLLKTPHIDRVAREGLVFNNAFFSCPQCTPSRGAIVTGSYFWRLGSATNLKGGDWRAAHNPFDDFPKFPDLLSKHGYATAKAFKTLQFTPTLGPANARRAGTEFLRYGLHLSEAKSAQDREKRRNEIIAQTRDAVRSVLTGCPADRPFFFVFGPINVHRPYAPGSGRALWNIDPEQLRRRLPYGLPDAPDVREDVADYLGEIQALDLMLGIFLEELTTSGRLDDTLLVVTGDNGGPGFPRGKTQMYDMGTRAPLLVRWPGRVAPGRTCDDFVNLMDLAPTFLEAAGVPRPATTDGRSLMPQLTSTQNSGTIDPTRDHVIFGRERHYPTARAGNLPYPERAVRTKDFLYVHNFKPDRWPMGDPIDITDASTPPVEALRTDTDVTYRDLDASLTKAWLIEHRNDPDAADFYKATFAKRPADELYDLRIDPDQLQNVAGDPKYAGTMRELSDRLMRVLRDTKDPRLADAPDRPPYVEADPKTAVERRAGRRGKKGADVD